MRCASCFITPALRHSTTPIQTVSELLEQLHQFIKAPMNVANDVEGTVLLLLVVPQRLSFKDRSIHLFRRVEHKHMAKALKLQAPQRAPELLALLANHVRAKIAVGPLLVAIVAKPFGQIENDRDRQTMEIARQLHKRAL